MPKNYNISPYYDDYDSLKNFLRILFNPSRAVQARELTQLQTILTNQKAQFANHFFTDGSKILGAKIELDQKITTLSLNNFVGATDASDFVGYYIRGMEIATNTATGASANAILDYAGNLHVAYRGGEFQIGDRIEIIDYDSEGLPSYTAEITAIGTAVHASLAEGLIYVAEQFVQVQQQTAVIDGALAVDLVDDTNIQVGFTILEDEVDSNEDNTLFDPAQGSYNFNAPGADRYRVQITLASYEEAAIPIDGTFYAKMWIQKKKDAKDYSIIKEEADTEYSDVLELLAKRTYETNGDYTVDPFMSNVKDHDSDNAKFNIALDAGIAYVKGYRHETISETYLEFNKARDFLNNTESVWIDQSPYIKVARENMVGLPDPTQLELIDLYSVTAGWVSTNILGTARVIGFIFTGSEYRLYLTDYESVQGSFASVKGVKSNAGTFEATTILEDATALNPAHTLLYSTTSSRVNAYGTAQTILKSNDASKFIHRITKTTQANVSAGVATIGTSSTEEIDQSRISIVSDTTDDSVLVPNVDYTEASDANTITLTFLNGQTANVNVVYYAEVTGAPRKTKVISTFVQTATTDANGKFTCTEADVIKINTIIEDPNGTPISIDPSVGKVDTGQRDYYYDYGAFTGLTAATEYEIEYNHYVHGGSGNYFDIDSYLSTGVPQEDIPTYKSATNSDTIFLGDVIDFRRKIAEVNVGVPVPTPRSYMFADYEYYLDRIDLIEIDKDGQFNIVEGVSSLSPTAPEGNDNAMTLYVVNVPAYTYDILDVYTGFVENKNYTMRDIGELEQRIGNLEYYSSLNLLEKEASELEITDQNGLNVFKNGILVDNFLGGNVVDVDDPEYFCAFDPDAGHLRSVFNVEDANLSTDTSEHSGLTDNLDGTFSDPVNKVRFHPNMVTVEYSTVAWIEQMKASQYMNVNPYNVFAWDGDLVLTPDTDNWIDTQWLPDLVTNIDGLYDNLVQKTIAAYGTKWGSWKTNWTGRSSVTENIPGHGGRTSEGWAKIDTSRLIRRSGVKGNTIKTTTTITKQMRRGTRLVAVPNRIKKIMGSRVVDVSVIPYMRSIPVAFEAKNLKPNTDLHCFFNDVDVDDHITPDSGFEPLVASFSVATDASGKCKGTFQIPATDALRFRTGQRPFCLIDDTFNPTTSAEAEFLAAGHLQKKQRDVLSISKPKLITVGVTQKRTKTDTRRDFVGWYDPVAESFLVEQEGGVFATSIEVFFKTKDAALPVSIQVVTTDNGYPSQNQVPFSQVTIDPADVNLSDDSSVGTTFQFSNPIYLENGTEYAFIVYSNSDAYNIWYGEIGGFDVEALPNEERIVAQPYTGVFFKSQNGSTWTADQTKDLKFNINRAKFETKTGDLTTGNLFLVQDDGSDVYVTDCQFEIDNLVFDLTSLTMSFKFFGQALWTEFLNSEDLGMVTQQHVTDAEQLKNKLILFTENEWVSPVINLQRSHVILINNILFDWAANPLPYEDAGSVPDGFGQYDAGVYVSRPTTLINPSDDIRVIIDVLKQGESDVDLYFSTGKFSPKYVEIYDTDVDSARPDMKGQTLFLIDMTVGGVCTKQTEMTCTSVDTTVTPNRIYLTGIGDPTTFKYHTDWTGTNRMYVTTEDVDAETILDWDIATAYTGGEYVFFQNYLWLAAEASTAVEPSDYGTTWDIISFNDVCQDGVAGEELKTDTERTWRPMIIEGQDNDDGFATTNFVEYTFIPKDLIEEEFSTFAIKIQLKAKDPTLVPICSGLRAIATY